MKNILFICLLLTLGFGAGCSSNTTEKQPDEAAMETPAAGSHATETQLAYICPMECEGSASHDPGKCPVCGMDLVKNPNYKAPGQDSTATGVVN
jgi:hypothetical protein